MTKAKIPVTSHERLVLSMAAAAVANGAQCTDSRLLIVAMDLLNNLASGRLDYAVERLKDLEKE